MLVKCFACAIVVWEQTLENSGTFPLAICGHGCGEYAVTAALRKASPAACPRERRVLDLLGNWRVHPAKCGLKPREKCESDLTVKSTKV
jgi:hypothetical protein